MNPQFCRAFTASVALKAYQAVVLDTTRGAVKLGASANGAVIGYAMNDADAGQEVSVFLVGPVFRGIAGDNSIAIGDYVMLEGSDGKLKKVIDDNVLFNWCGISLETATGEDQIIEIIATAGKAFTALS